MTAKTVRQAIAARLKQARKKAGYASAEDFCQKNELSLDLYIAQEKGEKPLKSVNAFQYCKLLGLPLNKLLIGD